ncbi:hypothetical protein E1301_Tti023976 [Triplophysa tibetana]|uniref:Uncharacterized protein n=1 Tax=Triplophysa tibetana TaxID=1572043 RepID=A0A5A9MUP1_9TELE|nr:hypothetical protein E1301_Tti023976 [Triplophysa tibetana]
MLHSNGGHPSPVPIRKMDASPEPALNGGFKLPEILVSRWTPLAFRTALCLPGRINRLCTMAQVCPLHHGPGRFLLHSQGPSLLHGSGPTLIHGPEPSLMSTTQDSILYNYTAGATTCYSGSSLPAATFPWASRRFRSQVLTGRSHPIRSSERSPTGGGIPSGSSATHSETMCDIDEMSLAASEGDWHPTLTNPSSTPSGRVQDEAEVMSSVLTRGYVVPEASEISRDVCFPATQDPFDIGSGSCAPTGGTPEAEIEGETSTPSATFSREGTLTGRPQGEQHRARTFTATALIGRYGTAPASSPKPDPFQGLAPTYSQSFSVLPGCTCSRSNTPLDCARQTRPHALARRRVVYTRQLLPLSNRQCVQLSR